MEGFRGVKSKEEEEVQCRKMNIGRCGNHIDSFFMFLFKSEGLTAELNEHPALIFEIVDGRKHHLFR
jgi:hypothetical protein